MHKERLYCLKNAPAIYNHIWEGELLQHSDSQVFKDKWFIQDFKEDEEAEKYYGIDFGFVHPMAVIRCYIKDNCILGSYAALAGEVEVNEFAIVSPATLVHQFVRIGTHVMTQGGSKVSKDIPPYVLAGREPLAYTGINSVGLRRRGFTNESIYEIQEMYRIIYQRNLNIPQL